MANKANEFNKYIEQDGRLNFKGAPDEIFMEAFKKIKLFSKPLSEHTVKAYNEDVDSFMDFILNKEVLLSEVNVITIQEYQVYLTSNFANRTAARKLGILKRLVSFGYLTNFYGFSMVEYIDTPKKAKFLTSDKGESTKGERRKLDLEEALIILDALEKVVITKKRYRDVLILRNKLIGFILLTAGLRASEIVNLKWSDIVIHRDRRNNTVNYSVDFSGKGKKPRKVPLNEKVINALYEYRNAISVTYPAYSEDFKGDDRPIFISTTRTDSKADMPQLSYRALHNLIKQAVTIAAANEKISPHWFRHTFVTQLLEQDVPLAIVKDLAGHSDIATTNLYIESMNDNVVNREYSKVDFGI
ncbi:tyrosine-type recombinase/integrase [Priestia megaterium]|uniref:tyrosine-type recombinase/integrase n=1 Tax=Priestia megaterium TaxID=1404 RepID=UPI002E1C467B|nr:tyrosine-type recombinase/integrase [Priestia megaterium]MED4285503.1 tyrosine-type recombinase/integrase [Priestia megaterium]